MTRTNPHNPPNPERLAELLADEQLDQLSLEDRAELERLHPDASQRYDGPVSTLAQRIAKDAPPLPPDVRERLARRGRRIVGAEPLPFPSAKAPSRSARRLVPLLAAMIAIAAGAAFFVLRASVQRLEADRQAAQAQADLAEVRLANAELLTQVRNRADELARAVAGAEARTTDLERRVADGAAREVRIAQDLHDATERLDAANLRIAKYETPADPATMEGNRRKLLDVPGTIRIAWKPFDLPDAPAEQQGVAGDVVWNDELEQGFLRFVGLKRNDPAVEQYQVWVIDERGMEQKVSGGVFNASADGEVIVPIHPGIDVRRVSLFAITVEEPGGTWVPSLKRRIVVAPRAS